MKHLFHRAYLLVRAHRIVSAVITLVVIGTALIVSNIIIANLPKPLGNEFEYLGKTDYGCWYPLCTSKPGSEYYYGTDMDEEAITSYFTKKGIRSKPSAGGVTGTFSYDTVSFTHKNDTFSISFYNGASIAISEYGLKTSHKKNLISIDSSNYRVIRELTR